MSRSTRLITITLSNICRELFINHPITVVIELITELLKRFKLNAREELKIWLGYAMGNYTEAKLEIEALFPDLLRSAGVEDSDEGPNITRTNRSLTNRWRLIGRKVALCLSSESRAALSRTGGGSLALCLSS